MSDAALAGGARSWITGRRRAGVWYEPASTPVAAAAGAEVVVGLFRRIARVFDEKIVVSECLSAVFAVALSGLRLFFFFFFNDEFELLLAAAASWGTVRSVAAFICFIVRMLVAIKLRMPPAARHRTPHRSGTAAASAQRSAAQRGSEQT
jgi:hypothetical protein